MGKRLLTAIILLMAIGLPALLFTGAGAASGGADDNGYFNEEDSFLAKANDKARQRARHYYKLRAFPFGRVPRDWRMKALDHMRTRMPARKKIGPQVVGPLMPIGPAPISGGFTFAQPQNVSGRVTALAADPQNPATIYLGGAQGGVWRTTNGGQTWQPMTENAPTQAVGAIAIDPTNRNVIYVGTGEANLSGDSFAGMGILKSTDGGQSWENLAAQTFIGLGFSGLIIDPSNTNTLYASVADAIGGLVAAGNPNSAIPGVYKSTDGGISWRLVFRVNFNENFPLPAMDLEMDPTNPSILYSTFFFGGIFKTTDGGQNWVKLAGGLPNSGFDRPDIGIARSNPNTLYAAFGSANSGDLLSIFRSTDGGGSWVSVADPPRTAFGNVCQCFYDNVIVVDPNDANTLYYGAVTLYKSSDAGLSWRDIGKGNIGLHPDFHAMIFLSGSSSQLIVGNDGGVWSSPDAGNSWININSNLSLTQFQSIAVHPTDPNVSAGGTQDNGSLLFSGNNSWQMVFGGDGGIAQIDQNRPNIVYVNTQSSFLKGPFRSEQGGRLNTFTRAANGISQSDRALFYAPFILDPNNQSTLYYGTSRLYRSMDQGRNWMAISENLTSGGRDAISTIAVAPSSARFIYTGSAGGAVFASSDGGATFRNVTANLPMRSISDIAVDPNSPATVYVTVSGFGSGHVFKSTTGGGNWQDVSGNLPDVPANAIAINARDANQIFVGNDMGLFESTDGGATWTIVPGMPFVAVFDIAINERLGFLRVATHGRGIYEAQIGGASTGDDFSLSFSPSPLRIVRLSSGTVTVNINRRGDFTGNVTVTLTPNKDVKAKITPMSAVVSGSGLEITVKLKKKAAAGAFPLTFTGRDDNGRVRTNTLQLVILN